MEADYILIEADLNSLKSFVENLEKSYEIQITKKPFLGLTMVKANDSVEKQPFYLGEALVTETEVSINNQAGIGICVGDESVRSYCVAVIDALLQLKDENLPIIQDFLDQQAIEITKREKKAHHRIQKTKVDFKLMDQS